MDPREAFLLQLLLRKNDCKQTRLVFVPLPFYSDALSCRRRKWTVRTSHRSCFLPLLVFDFFLPADGSKQPPTFGSGQQRAPHPRPFFYVQPPSQPYYMYQHWQMNNPYSPYGLPGGSKQFELFWFVLLPSNLTLCLCSQVLTLAVPACTRTSTCSTPALFSHTPRYIRWTTGGCLTLASMLLLGVTCLASSITSTLRAAGKWPVRRLRRTQAMP